MVLCGHCHCYLEAEARRSRRTCLRSHDVFICSCFYSKVPQTGGLKQQSLISHSSAVWDVQGQGAGRFSVWRETSPWSWTAALPCCPHLAFPWCELRKRALPSPPLPIRPPIPSRGPHLHRGLGLPRVNSGEGSPAGSAWDRRCAPMSPTGTGPPSACSAVGIAGMPSTGGRLPDLPANQRKGSARVTLPS